jgi:hypothetical protein
MANARAAAAGTHEQSEHQREAAEELRTASEQRHGVAGRQADRVHPLAGAFQAVAAEPAEQLLRAVCGEDDAGSDAQREGAPAGVGGEQSLDESGRLGHGGLPWFEFAGGRDRPMTRG